MWALCIIILTIVSLIFAGIIFEWILEMVTDIFGIERHLLWKTKKLMNKLKNLLHF